MPLIELRVDVQKEGTNGRVHVDRPAARRVHFSRGRQDISSTAAFQLSVRKGSGNSSFNLRKLFFYMQFIHCYTKSEPISYKLHVGRSA